jgi:hypothetical protein
MSDHMTHDPQFPEAELARLADGSLSTERQAELRGEIQSSPQLARALKDQERAVALIRSTDEVSAPASLRASLAGLASAAAAPERPVRRRPRLRLRFGLPVAGALGAAAAAAVVVVIAVGGGSSGLSVPQTAQVALASPTLPAPPESATNRAQLAVQVDGISFPYWERVGWRTLGRRSDTLHGHRVVTVFYASRSGSRVGYAIVAGSPLPVSGGRTVMRNGMPYTLLTRGNSRLVTWRRSGHTCIIAGHGVSDSTLVSLAEADSVPATSD